MADVTVQVDGLRETVRDLERVGVEVADLKTVFGTIAAEGAHVAETFTPHASGALAATVRGNKAKNKAVVTFGTARIRYAGPIIYGWPARNIAPAQTVERTDAVMDTRAPQLLEEGLTDIYERYGFA